MNGTSSITLSEQKAAGGWRRRAAVIAVTAAAIAGPALVGSATASANPAPGQGEVYVLHGLAGVTADVVVDGQVQMRAAQPQSIVGPLGLAPGAHTVTLDPTTGPNLTASVQVTDGSSQDVVAHLPADAGDGPVLTVFANDLSPVGAGKARVVVAHTAAVPPADVRVDGEVLFSNVANAESLELMVPAATYSVDIVPTGSTTPVVFGPVDLTVQAGTLTRVFAFGDPTEQSMNAIVQSLPVAQEGAVAPALVPTGDGGQAALATTGGTSSLPVLAGGLLLTVALAGAALRRRGQSLAV